MMIPRIAGLVRSPVEHPGFAGDSALCCMSQALLRRQLGYKSFISWCAGIFRDIVYLLFAYFIMIYNQSLTVYF